MNFIVLFLIKFLSTRKKNRNVLNYYSIYAFSFPTSKSKWKLVGAYEEDEKESEKDVGGDNFPNYHLII